MIGVLLQMQKNDIALYKGEEVRVLSIDADNAYVISLSGKSAPRLAKIDEIDEVEVKEVKQHLTMQTLTANQESIMWKRYRIITPLLIQACNKKERTKLLNEISVQEGITKNTLKNWLYKYLASQDIYSLCPVERNYDEQHIPSELADIFKYSLNKWYLSPSKVTLRYTYERMLGQFFTDTNGKLLNEYPSYRQLQYFKNQTVTKINEYCSRNGKGYFSRNQRPLIHDGLSALYPFEIYQTDAQLLDLYVFKDYLKQEIGRPTLVVAIDVFSQAIVGYSISFYSSDTSTIYALLFNIIEHYPLPKVLITDRGAEFTGNRIEQISLFTELQVMESYRPDLKANVEKWFDILNSIWTPFFQGKGRVHKPKEELPYGMIDYKSQAVITLEEFEKEILIQSIDYYNNEHVLKNYKFTPEMLKENVVPTPKGLIEYACNKYNLVFQPISPEILKLVLLERTTAKFTRKGLKLTSKLYYFNYDYQNEMLIGKKTVIVAYDAENINKIWMIENLVYIPFFLIQERYQDLSMSDYEKYQEIEKGLLNQYKESELQAKIDLNKQIKGVLDGKRV